MNNFKRWEDLTFTDDFMFSQVMKDKEICREVIETLQCRLCRQIKLQTLQRFIKALNQSCILGRIYSANCLYSPATAKNILPHGLIRSFLIGKTSFACSMLSVDSKCLTTFHEVKKVRINYKCQKRSFLLGV